MVSIRGVEIGVWSDATYFPAEDTCLLLDALEDTVTRMSDGYRVKQEGRRIPWARSMSADSLRSTASWQGPRTHRLPKIQIGIRRHRRDESGHSCYVPENRNCHIVRQSGPLPEDAFVALLRGQCGCRNGSRLRLRRASLLLIPQWIA